MAEKVYPHQDLTEKIIGLTGCKVGLLLNFNSAVLKDGIERLVL